MSFDFVQGAIENGCYEPEGVYLTAPFEGRRRVVQEWGVRPEYYRRFVVGAKALLGHNGVDFEMIPRERIVAADRGIITTIGNDHERFGRFIRIVHPWGESLYTRFRRRLSSTLGNVWSAESCSATTVNCLIQESSSILASALFLM